MFTKLANLFRSGKQNAETISERSILDHDYVRVEAHDGQIVLSFENEDDKILAIGEKMNEIHEGAYMNGYNWDVFFRHFLSVKAPEILEGMESDPEAGAYVAYFEDTAKNERKGRRFAEIIISLIENEEELYQIIREKGDEIAWED